MIIAWGTEEQRNGGCPRILDASDHWCQGFSEPDAGNDLANLRTTALRDGDGYVVNGQKIWISTAHLARWGLFLLRTDPTAIERGAKHEGITAFIVDMHTPGIEVRPIRDMTGEEMFNEVYFRDAHLPLDSRLGGEGEGWMVAMGTLGHERVGIAGQISSLAADLRAMVMAARSVNPAALDDPSIRDRLARAWTDIELARLLTLRALSKIIKGEKNWPEVPFAKLQWSVLAQTLADLAVDLLGPSGLLARGGPGRGRPRQVDPALRLPALQHHRRRLDRGAEEHHRRPGDPAPRSGPHLLSPVVAVDPRAPCIVGVARRTWREIPAPEPLAMWEELARAAAADAGSPDAVTVTPEPPGRLLPGVGVRRPVRPAGRTARGRSGPPGLLRDSAARSRCAWSPMRPTPWPGASSTSPSCVGGEALATRRRLPEPAVVLRSRGGPARIRSPSTATRRPTGSTRPT